MAELTKAPNRCSQRMVMVVDDRESPVVPLEPVVKRVYAKPELVYFGKVRELTAGVKGSGGDFTRRKT
jgi:hypothetical protein